MKNLKKVLALVLACATLFTMSSFAFTDVEEDASYLEAVTMLSKLGIINGYEDGTFLPDNTITRAEAAKVLVCALNAEDSALGMADQELFTDVPASHWAAGYVNYAANFGIIAGRGNGIFDPESPVSYEEIVKMVVAMLGYTPVADIKGGYPTGYLYVANNVAKITKGATGTTGDAAKRWVVARLVFNSLETKIMEPEKWSASDPEYIKGDDTLLKDYLEVTKIEGIVTDTFMVDGDFKDKDDQDVTIMINTIDGMGTRALENADLEYGVMPGDKYTVEANGTYAEDYLGYTVVAYVQEFDEGSDTLVAIAPKSGKNSTLDVAFDQFVKDGVDDSSDKYIEFEYDVDDDTDTAKVSLKTDDNDDLKLNVFENMAKASNPDTKALALLEKYADYDGVAEEEGYVRFLDNDGDGYYEYMFVEVVNKEYVVESITAKSYKVKDEITGTTITLDPTDDDRYVSFYKNDVQVDFSDIEEGDVLSVVLTGKKGAAATKPNNAQITKVYISSDKVEGYVSTASATKNEYKIDGTIYGKSVNYTKDYISRGDEGTFYLNYKGRIAYANAEETKDGNYAFLLSINTDRAFEGDDPTFTFRFMNEKGEWVDADLYEKPSFILGDAKAEKMDDFEDMIDRIATVTNGWLKVVGGADTGKLTMDGAVDQRVFKYTLNSNGQISKIYIPTETLEEDEFTYVVATESVYKESSNKFASFSKKGGVDEDTIIFNVDLKDGEDMGDVKKSKVSLETSAIFKDEEKYTAAVYEYSDGVYAAMVVTNATNTIDEESSLLVIKSVELTNDGDDDYFVIEGYKDGEEVTLESVITDELEIEEFNSKTWDEEDLEDLATGSLAEVALDGAGKIGTIRILLDADKVDEDGYDATKGVSAFTYSDDADAKSDYFFGAIVSEKASGKGMVIDLGPKYDDADYEGIATAGSGMKGNIYLVKYGTKKNTITVDTSIADYVGSLSDEMEEKDTVYVAFVKTYDTDDTIDVVVYELEVK